MCRAGLSYRRIILSIVGETFVNLVSMLNEESIVGKKTGDGVRDRGSGRGACLDDAWHSRGCVAGTQRGSWATSFDCAFFGGEDIPGLPSREAFCDDGRKVGTE